VAVDCARRSQVAAFHQAEQKEAESSTRPSSGATRFRNPVPSFHLGLNICFGLGLRECLPDRFPHFPLTSLLFWID